MTVDKAEMLRKWISKPYGLIICTGPTGCGKTTTAYLMLKELASKEGQKIIADYGKDKYGRPMYNDAIYAKKYDH